MTSRTGTAAAFLAGLDRQGQRALGVGARFHVDLHAAAGGLGLGFQTTDVLQTSVFRKIQSELCQLDRDGAREAAGRDLLQRAHIRIAGGLRFL
ncbi:MAG TPA: hypothetical protein VE958_16865, partial [Bryobacteraceae bacterium]|nr:hypothetical protein [Bryobacteraceae bacterium]